MFGNSRNPGEPVRPVVVVKLPDQPHSKGFLSLDELLVEQWDELVLRAGGKLVLAKLDDLVVRGGTPGDCWAPAAAAIIAIDAAMTVSKRCGKAMTTSLSTRSITDGSTCFCQETRICGPPGHWTERPLNCGLGDTGVKQCVSISRPPGGHRLQS